MKTYREGLVEAKAARTGIVEQRPVGTQGKKTRPVIVEALYTGRTIVGRPEKWRKWGSYRNEAEAQTMIDQQARKRDCYQYRIKQ